MAASRNSAFFVVGLLLLTAAGCCAGAFVSIDANPVAITADGKSSSQILITVLDNTGAPATDNTEVRLTTSAGDVTPVVYTTGGRAIGILTSSACPQIAVIGASVDGSTGSVQVEFVESASGDGASEGATIRVAGGSLAYSVDHDTVMASGGVTIDYRGIRVEAASAQVCQTSGQIRAQGSVSVSRKDQTLSADALACDTRSDRIRLLNSRDESSLDEFDSRLKPIESQGRQGGPQECASLACSGGRTWIVSERLDIIPGDRILFYNASIYVKESKVIKVPYYVYSYQTRESILQQVRYTSGSGILVDMPVYYQMTPARTGALKLRFAGEGNESGGYWRPRKGLSFGLEQAYFIRDRAHGRLFVDSIGSAAQAYELAHHLDFGAAGSRGRLDISTRFQPRSSYARNLHNTTLNLTGNTAGCNYSLYGYFGGNAIRQADPLHPESIFYEDQSSVSMRAVIRPRSAHASRMLGRMSPSLTLGYGTLANSSGEMLSTRLYHSVGLSFSRASSLSRTTSITFDGSAALTLTAEGDSGAAIRAGPNLRKNWKGGSGSISATANLQQGTTDTGMALADYQLACNLFLHDGSRFTSSTSVNYGLDSGRMNLFSSLNYRPARPWLVRSSYSLCWYACTFNGSTYRYRTSYLKVGVYRPFGLYEIGLAWSPNGRDYGIEKDKHLWLELNSSAF